jgi:hypothetical protein
MNNFKANEYRNILFYAGIYCFAKILNKDYFTHFSIYITAMRLLTKEKITIKNIEDASILINHFVMQFKHKYGIENMDYKLHAHLHFPDQVERYGGLNSLNCFAFEGNFEFRNRIFNLQFIIK